MKPLDDFLPEETHHPEPITASEREETIARARERLSSQISGTAAHAEEVPIQLAGVTQGL